MRRGWDYVYTAAKNKIKDVWNNHIVPTFNRLKNAAQAKARQIIEKARAVTVRAKAAIHNAVQHVSLKSIASMVTAGLSSLTMHISAGLLPKMVQSFTSVVQDIAGATKALYSSAVSAGAMLVSGVKNAADFVVDHKAAIIGGVVGLAVGLGCGVAIGVTGVGAVACAAAAGAADSLVSDLVQGGKGWKEMAADTLLGAVTGAVMGPLTDVGGSAIGGAARGLIRGGMKQAFEDGSAALASSARSYGNSQVGGLVGKALAGRTAGSAGREAVETTGASVQSSAHAQPRPSSCNSFAAGTAVLMADGTTKPIDQVKIGDKVIATDPTTGRTSARAVTALITGIGTKQMVELTIDTDGTKGGKTATIDATDNHPFWVPDLHRWIPASALKTGSLLEAGPGTYVQVTATRTWTAAETEVHNLTIDRLHTYYVLAGNTPVLVHNCGEAVVHLDPVERHATISIRNGDEVLHTEQLGTTGTDAIPALRTAPHSPTTINVRIPLRNPGGAMAYQEVTLGRNLGPYNEVSQSCVTYCGNVLKAGGVEGVPDTTLGITKWLLQQHG